MNLFETYTGADFLAFYAVMLATCIGLSLWIPANLHSEGRKSTLDDPEEIAFLSGGFQRHALVVLADLHVQGAIDRATKAKASVTRTEIEASSAGAAVLRKVGDFSLKGAMKTVRRYARDIERSLIKRGLLLESKEVDGLRIASVMPFAALFGLGLYRQQAGADLGEPTDYLVILLAITAFAAFVRFIFMDRRTRAGNALLAEWRERSSRIKRAPDAGEVPLAVSLFGTGVLVGTPYAHVHAMKKAVSGGDGGSNSGSGGDDSGWGGDGGGSGCGGGCGGCGG